MDGRRQDHVTLGIEQALRSASGRWYKVVQRLGQGGAAVTYLVLATAGPTRGVPFALKLFRRVSKPERRDTFLDEVKFLENCEHPSIMRVFDRGIYNETHPFLVAEYLPHTLADVIRSDSATTAEKASYTLQLLSALDYLASRRPAVVHRDITPQNIFLKGRSCVLGDFGLLKRVGTESSSESTGVENSPAFGMPKRYRTPDLVGYLKGEAEITSRSDVFQLGLVVAELFAGVNIQQPSDAIDDPIDLDLKQLDSIRGALRPLVANLVSRMLAMSSEERGDAADFIDPWQGVFFNAVKRAHDLEGRVF